MWTFNLNLSFGREKQVDNEASDYYDLSSGQIELAERERVVGFTIPTEETEDKHV